MKKSAAVITAIVFTFGCSSAYVQDHSQHQGTTDHSQHQAGAAMDHMAHLDADLEEIRNTADPALRKQKLAHHLHMMSEQLKGMAAMHGGGMMGMNHGEGGQGGGMQGMNHGEGGQGGGMQGMNHGEGGQRGGMQGMNHGEGGQGGGGHGGGMMEHHTNMVKMLEHMIATQELLLGLID